MIKKADISLLEEIAFVMDKANHRDKDWSYPRINKYILKKNHDILVAVYGKVVGYVGIKHEEDLCQITWIGVLPEYQGKGIGKELIASAEEWIDGRGYWLGCKDKLLGYYQKLGMEVFGKVDGRWRVGKKK